MKLRVLVVDEWIPLPLDSGKKIRTFQLLSPLARRHSITYLCYADVRREAGKIAKMEEAGFRMVCVPPVRKFDTPVKLAAGVLANFLRPAPLAVRKHYSRPFQQVLDRLATEHRLDLIHCEWTHYAQFVRQLRDRPRFLCAHNVESMHWERFVRVARNPLRRAILRLESLKMARFERRAIAEFDHVAAVSTEDVERMKASFGAHSADVIPNGVDMEFYAAVNHSGNGESLIYCASMDSFVNQDAVFYFVERILPKILEKKPQVRFMIVGRSPPPAIRRLAGDHISVSGSVDDIRPFLGSATASVVPLRIAGGSRLKILESIAAGLPVVSTSIGAEGLRLQAGSQLLIANDESSFASQCVRLLDQSHLREQLVRAGRVQLKEKYEWKSIVPLVEAAWQRARRNFVDNRTRGTGAYR